MGLLLRIDAVRLPPATRAVATGLLAAAVGACCLEVMPELRTDLFAAGAARLAAMLTGATRAGGDVSTFVSGDQFVAVTTACSGTDFFLMVAALIGWRLGSADRSVVSGIFFALGLAVPVTVAVNALRVVAVMQAHRWLIPLLPEPYGAFAHMAAGAAVFLPALIVLNLLLETYGRLRRSASRHA